MSVFEIIPAPEAALAGLGKAALHACAALAGRRGKDTWAQRQDEDITRADGIALISDLGGDAFVRLRGS